MAEVLSLLFMIVSSRVVGATRCWRRTCKKRADGSTDCSAGNNISTQPIIGSMVQENCLAVRVKRPSCLACMSQMVLSVPGQFNAVGQSVAGFYNAMHGDANVTLRWGRSESHSESIQLATWNFYLDFLAVQCSGNGCTSRAEFYKKRSRPPQIQQRRFVGHLMNRSSIDDMKCYGRSGA